MSWPDETVTTIDRETLDALAKGEVPEDFRRWCDLERLKMDANVPVEYAGHPYIPRNFLSGHREKFHGARRTGW